MLGQLNVLVAGIGFAVDLLHAVNQAVPRGFNEKATATALDGACDAIAVNDKNCIALAVSFTSPNNPATESVFDRTALRRDRHVIKEIEIYRARQGFGECRPARRAVMSRWQNFSNDCSGIDCDKPLPLHFSIPGYGPIRRLLHAA